MTCWPANLVFSAVASASAVAQSLGPFDTPFQPEKVTDYNRLLFNAIPKEVIPTLPRLASDRRGASDSHRLWPGGRRILNFPSPRRPPLVGKGLMADAPLVKPTGGGARWRRLCARERNAH